MWEATTFTTWIQSTQEPRCRLTPRLTVARLSWPRRSMDLGVVRAEPHWPSGHCCHSWASEWAQELRVETRCPICRKQGPVSPELAI